MKNWLFMPLIAVLVISSALLYPYFCRDALAGDVYMGHLQIGKNYLVNGSYDRAVREFSSAIKLKPQDAQALIERGTAYNQLEDYKLAIDDFSRALKIDPKNYLAFNNRGVSYFRTGKFEQAVSDFDNAIKLNTKDPYSRLNYAGAAICSGNGSIAAQKLTAFLNDTNWKGKFAGHCAVLAILGNKLGGRQDASNKLLSESLKRIFKLDWPYPYLKYLNNQMPVEEVLSSVKNSDYDTTQARCFLGLSRLQAKEDKLAYADFEWVVKFGTKDSVEYWLAKNLLENRKNKTRKI